MDESSNVLRNSAEFDNSDINRSNTLNGINYDKMDEINQNLDKSGNKSHVFLKPAEKSLDFTLSSQTNDQTDFELTPKVKLNIKPYERQNSDSSTIPKSKEIPDFTISNYDSNEADVDKLNITSANDLDKSSFNLTSNSISNQNDLDFTVNTTNNQSSIERINQLMMQSVERVKRIAQAHSGGSGDDYLTLINQNSNIKSCLNQDRKQSANRFSTSTVSSFKNFQNSNNDMSLNFSTLPSNNKNDANLTNLDNTCLTTPSKTFEQSMTKNDQFQQQQQQSKNSDFGDFKVQQNQIETNPFDFDTSDCFGQPQQLGEFNPVGEFSDFKQADEFMEDLKEEEVINRKEFANNELSVCMNYDKTMNQSSSHRSSSGNESAGPSNEKWWNNMNAAQSSKLEVSDLSNMSNLNDTKSSISKPKIKTQTQTQKHKVAVGDYFTRKSEMPAYLSEKESGVKFDESIICTQNKPKCLPEPVLANSNSEQDNTICGDTNYKNSDEDITFSTSNNQGSSLSSSNFSFTLNSSDTGDFIKKKSQIPKKQTPSTTPFQLSKALASHMAKKQATETSLKSINEELDRVQTRLANSDQINTKPVKQTISEPLLSSSIKLSNNNKGMMIPMDETISSISSSDVTSKCVKTPEANKQKPASGSLTSTPSKLTKSVSEISNLNSVSTYNAKTVDASSSSSSNTHLFSQDSFISSIPERANDSTLVGNHHHQTHHHGNQKHKSVSHTTKTLKQHQKHKHAEIQTSPGQPIIESKKIPLLLKSSSQDENNRASISSVSSTSSSASSDTTNPSSLASQFNVINNLAAAMINSSASGNTTNAGNSSGLVPVAFIPINSFFPCVQKFYDDMQTTTSNKTVSNKSNFESSLSANSLNQPVNGKLFIETGYSVNSSSMPSLCSQNNATGSILNSSVFEIPQFELDKNSIDFGLVAEGCSQTLRIFAKLLNPTSVVKQMQQNSSGYFQVELCDSLEWSIETYEGELDEKNRKLNDEMSTNTKRKLNLSLKKKLEILIRGQGSEKR